MEAVGVGIASVVALFSRYWPFLDFQLFLFFFLPQQQAAYWEALVALALLKKLFCYVALNWGNPWQARADAAKRGRSRRIWPLQLGRGVSATLQHLFASAHARALGSTRAPRWVSTVAGSSCRERDDNEMIIIIINLIK